MGKDKRQSMKTNANLCFAIIFSCLVLLVVFSLYKSAINLFVCNIMCNYARKSIDFNWFRLFFIDFHWFSLIFVDFRCFPLVFVDFRWFLYVITCWNSWDMERQLVCRSSYVFTKICLVYCVHIRNIIEAWVKINGNQCKSMKNQWKSMKINGNKWNSMKLNENQSKTNENQWKRMQIYVLQ